MAKKRQADLSSSTLENAKPKRVKKDGVKKGKDVKSYSNLASTARELLFGGKKMRDLELKALTVPVTVDLSDIRKVASSGDTKNRKQKKKNQASGPEEKVAESNPGRLFSQLLYQSTTSQSVANTADNESEEDILAKLSPKRKLKTKAKSNNPLRLRNDRVRTSTTGQVQPNVDKSRPPLQNLESSIDLPEEQMSDNLSNEAEDNSEVLTSGEIALSNDAPQSDTSKSRLPIQDTLLAMACNDQSAITIPWLESPEPELLVEQFQHVCDVNSDNWVVAFTERVELRGLAKITLLSGSVKLHGYQMDVGKTLETYSPAGYNNTVLENQHNNQPIPAEDIMKELTCLIKDSEKCLVLKKFLSDHPGAAVVQVSNFPQNTLGCCLDQLPDRKYPGFRTLSKRGKLMISECHLNSRYSSSALNTVNNLVKLAESGEPIRLVICGSKDMGKSTLARLIINSLIRSRGEVAYLDCDPGQTEFSPPACLSLHSVKEPLLGPPWCRVTIKPDYVQFYGSVSADTDPDRYMSCVRQLVADYQSCMSSQILIVNTMGWKEALGLQFLSATITEVCPTHLIQLRVEENCYRNFPHMTMFKVATNNLFHTPHQTKMLHKHLKYDVLPVVMKHVPELVYSLDLLKASLSRDLMTAAYLSLNTSASNRNIHEIVPHRVKFSSVAIHLLYEKLPEHMYLSAIDGQVLALCCIDNKQIFGHGDHAFKILNSSPSDIKYLGYGLVRAIDVENEWLYITTPIPQRMLAEVNVLIKGYGSITPNFVFLQQLNKLSDGNQVPYIGMSKTGVALGSTSDAVKKFRRRRADPDQDNNANLNTV